MNMKKEFYLIISALLFLCLLVGPAFCQTDKEHLTKGNEYFDKGMYDKAIEEFNKAIEINPNDANAYNNRGFAYGMIGNLDQAIEDYNKAIEINPKLAEAYHDRGVAYFGKKEYDKAWQDVHMAESLGYEINPIFLEELKKESGKEK